MPPLKRPALWICALALLAACAAPQRPAPRGNGTLHISSVPSGARVIIDDAPTNFRTPTAVPVSAGQHRVMLSLVAHRNWEHRVRVEAGATTQVEAVLVALGSGSIGVTSTPTGAAILVDGEPTGAKTPADVPALAVGTHTIQLRLEGYEDWSQAIVVRQDRHFPFQALLAPARGTLGRLSVRSHPQRALISVDGAPSGKVTPETLENLPAGNHLLELTLAGYRPWSGTVAVREGQTRNVLVSMRRLPAQEAGSAFIDSDPPGASITIDGVPLRQKSPADLGALPPGTFTVELTRPGCKPWRGELTVLPGQRTLLQVPLEPAQ